MTHSHGMTAERWSRLQEIFLAVVELAPAEREAEIARRTADDIALQKLVTEMLRHDRPPMQSAGSSLQGPSNTDLTEANPDSATAIVATQLDQLSLRHRPGESAGQFRLLFPVAARGNSEVWCGELVDGDESTAERIAVKFFEGAGNDAQLLAGFAREARFLSGFRHPAIVQFVASGQTVNGTPFIATRFVEGDTITAFCDRNQLSLSQRCLLLAEVCDAIIYSHRFLVVHRDLKPANILVTKNGHPVVLDFGISAQPDSPGPIAKQFPDTGNQAMTPAWASPEQVRGGAITTATDVHAIGLILFELACGHHPFSEPACPDAKNLHERICENLQRRPSDLTETTAVCWTDDPSSEPVVNARLLAARRGLSPSQLRRDLRRGLDGIVLKAISANTDDRYASVADLRNDLINFANGQSLSIDSTPRLIQSNIRRRPLASAALFASVGLSIGAMASSLWWVGLNNQLRNALDHAVSNQNALKEDLELSQKTADNSQRGLEQLQNLVLGTQDTTDPITLGPGKLAADLPESSGEIRAELARQAANLGNFPRALALLNDIDPTDNVSPDTKHKLAEVSQTLGRPNAGLKWIGYSQPSKTEWERIQKTHDNPLAVHCTVLQLLLDAERFSEADEWNRLAVGIVSADLKVSSRRILLEAAAFFAIGWHEGAQERVDLLNAGPPGNSLSAPDQASLNLLCAKLDFLDSEDPDRSGIESIAGSSGDWTVLGNLARAEANLFLAGQISSDNNRDRAESILRRASEKLTAVGLEEHSVNRRVRLALASAMEHNGKVDPATEIREQLWKWAVVNQELGTTCSIRAGVESMTGKTDETVIRQMLIELAKVETVYSRDLYLARWVLTQHFNLDYSSGDWDSATVTADKLVVLELQLWGAHSWEYALALAGQISAIEKRGTGESVAQNRALLKSIVETLTNQNDSEIASAFVMPLLKSDSIDTEISDFELIKNYYEQRYNPAQVQLEMIRYCASNWSESPVVVDTMLGSAARILERNADFRHNCQQEIAAIESSLPDSSPLKPEFKKLLDDIQGRNKF